MAVTLSISEFIKTIEKEFGSTSYRAVSPEGKVYEGWKDKRDGAKKPEWFDDILGIPEDEFVIPCLAATSSDFDERGFPVSNRLDTRKGKRK